MLTILSTIRSLYLPLSIIIGYLIIGFFLRGLLPPVENIYLEFERLFREYGYYIIFIGALLEAALLINFLVPGGSIILAGAYFSSQGLIPYPYFFLTVIIGTLIGFSLDYLVGFFGWSHLLTRFGLHSQLSKAEHKINSYGFRAYFLGYIHPDLGSFYAIASGTLQIKWRKFIIYSIPNLSFWILFWTLPIYFFGELFKRYMGQYMLIGLLIIIAVFVLPKLSSKLIKNN